MSPNDRFVVWLIAALVLAFIVAVALPHIRGWLDRRYLREQQRNADARLAEFRRQRRRRRHAAAREEFRERLRREKEGEQ